MRNCDQAKSREKFHGGNGQNFSSNFRVNRDKVNTLKETKMKQSFLLSRVSTLGRSFK